MPATWVREHRGSLALVICELRIVGDLHSGLARAARNDGFYQAQPSSRRQSQYKSEYSLVQRYWLLERILA